MVPARARQGVIDGGVFREEFGGEISVGDVLIMRGEDIRLQAKRAHAKIPADADLPLDRLAN